MQLNLIDYKELTQTPWEGGVNTIMIKCVLFLQKRLNAEKIVVWCVRALKLTISENNLHLHATHHATSTVSWGGLDKVYMKADMERGERRSTLGLNGHGTEVELRAQG